MRGSTPETGRLPSALDVAVEGSCRVCGCIDTRPCRTKSPDGSAQPCWWIEPDLCSACEATPQSR